MGEILNFIIPPWLFVYRFPAVPENSIKEYQQEQNQDIKGKCIHHAIIRIGSRSGSLIPWSFCISITI